MANVQPWVNVKLSTGILLMIWHDTSEEVAELSKKSSLPEFNRGSVRLIVKPNFFGENLAK